MINPEDISTIRVGQLSPTPFNLTDNIPHEVGTDLNRGTIQQFADFLATYIGATSSIAFRPITVLDGETLPTTTQEEWILVGSGTFYNVGGGATLVCTEELNAIMSNGDYWFIGVQIPINVDLAGITQFIRAGFTNTTPSENAIFNALALKADASAASAPLAMSDFARLLVTQQDFNIPSGRTAKWALVNGATWVLATGNNTAEANTFTQTGNTITFKTIRPINNYIIIFHQ